MKIVVAGCGKIGKTIVRSLIEEKHDVTVVDIEPTVVDELARETDVLCFKGNAAEYETLKSAGADRADLFIAATDSDETNMLSCFAARRMGAKHTAARIRNSANNTAESMEFLKQQLGLSLSFNPEMLTARAICDILKLPSALKVESFAGRRFGMIELVLGADTNLDGVALSDLKKFGKFKLLICVVSRKGEVFIPNGSFVLRTGDKLGILVPEENTERILRMMGIAHKPVKNAIILGAGKTTGYLCRLLRKSRIEPKVIEVNQERCEALLEETDGLSVILGDGMSQELLAEEGIDDADAFVALTGLDEQNILISFYAMAHKVDKVVTKVSRDELSAISRQLGLECIVSTKAITADLIVQYARGLRNSMGSQVETLYSLMDGKAQALEFKVMSDFALVNIPLRKMKVKDDVLVAGIIRGREAVIPGGDDVILPGDRVIVISAGRRIEELADIAEAE